MLKLGKLKDPHHDAAAADVLAAFDAAQGGGLPTVECYHAAVGAWRRAHPDHTATYAAQDVSNGWIPVLLNARADGEVAPITDLSVAAIEPLRSIKAGARLTARDAPLSMACRVRTDWSDTKEMRCPDGPYFDTRYRINA